MTLFVTGKSQHNPITSQSSTRLSTLLHISHICGPYNLVDKLIGRVISADMMVSFHYGADHHGACQYDDSTMTQVQLGASRYGAFQYGAGPVWRCFSLAHSSMAQVQYGAFHYGAVPGWSFEASS